MKHIQTFTPLHCLWSRVAARYYGALVLMTLSAAFLVTPSRATNGTHALFDLQNPVAGPFPSNVFTIDDPTQITGLKVDMPMPDCTTQPSDCEDLAVINSLDGFNLLPRVSIPFDGQIDLTTVTSNSIFLINFQSGQRTGLNRVVWDPITSTLHFEADQLLDQHTTYALIVTDGVRDAQGRPVEASEEFGRFRHDLNLGQTGDRDLKNYRKSLLDALEAARASGVPERDIVSASTFTTQSATASLEKIRDQIKTAPGMIFSKEKARADGVSTTGS